MAQNQSSAAQVKTFDTSGAAMMLGISPSQFRAYAKKRGIRPASYQRRPYPYQSQLCPRWDLITLRRLKRRKSIVELRERRQRWIAGAEQRRIKAEAENDRRRATAIAEQDRRREALMTKYPTWRDALPDACAAMFVLNHFAKHRACTASEQQEIYKLKNGLIQILYRSGLATEVKYHIWEQPGLKCYDCVNGQSISENINWCFRCVGTGWHREARRLEFVAFRFVVAGVTYSWHQPRESVAFDYALTEQGESAWLPNPPEDGIEMSWVERQNAKEIILHVKTESAKDLL